jgi:hypothetical protein
MLDSFHSLTKTVSQIPVIFEVTEGTVLLDEPLFFHIVKYPQLRWSDVYKFIMQGTCGWAHLNKIGDEDHLQNFLEKEMSEAEEPFKGEELFELLEKETGLTRVNLRVWKRIEGNDYKALWKLMKNKKIESAQSLGLFVKRWKHLIKWFDKKTLSCPEENIEEVKKWLSLVLKIAENSSSSSDLPLVSHSDKYRELYKPKYRVI